MELNDFSSLIEVGVTLNIAFVAVEYVKSYTRVLCNQVFKLQEFISVSFNDCIKILVDEETLAHIQPNKIGENKNTNNLIEKAKRTREIIKKEIDTEKAKFDEKIENVCEAKNVSSISLWLFFYGLTALFLCGCEMPHQMEHTFWTFLSILTILYSIMGWFVHTNQKNVWIDFSSLRHAIIYFWISFVFCIIFVGVFHTRIFLIIEIVWQNILFLSLIWMFSNFVASVIMIWNKADAVRKEIDKSSKQIQAKCTNLQKDVDRLINVNELCAQLEIESSDS